MAAVLTAACSSDGSARSTDTTAESTTTTAAVTAAPEGEVATAEPVTSAGCGATAAGPVSLERRTLPGSDRWYLLTVPPAHDGATPLPLVLDFHGLSEGVPTASRILSSRPTVGTHRTRAASGSPQRTYRRFPALLGWWQHLQQLR